MSSAWAVLHFSEASLKSSVCGRQLGAWLKAWALGSS